MKPSLYFLALFLLLIACKHSTTEISILTEMGTIDIEVYDDLAPISAGNFLLNVDAQTYDNSMFYRTVHMENQTQNNIKIEVIQGGLFHDSIVSNYPTIPHETTAETGILHLNGVISMARSEPGSQSTEFFICIGDQPELDFGGKRNPDGQGFSAFGKVIKGMDIVRQIQHMPSEQQMLKPQVPIIKIVRKDQ